MMPLTKTLFGRCSHFKVLAMPTSIFPAVILALPVAVPTVLFTALPLHKREYTTA
jgi:hypothetical protein